MFSQRGFLVGENKSIASPNITPSSRAASCVSTCGKSFCSCVPRYRAAGASFVTCPTCQGSGVIPPELEKQLVALIPYGDQRLKPRRTKLFVFLAVLISLVTTSLLSFVLFPHSITVQPVGLNSSTVTFDPMEVHINITSILNISNNNYYPVTVTQLTIKALHVALVVGQVSLNQRLHVSPLVTQQMAYAVATRIGDESTHKICSRQEFKVHHVLLHIQGTLTYSYLTHSEQKVFESQEYVDCHTNISLAPMPASLLL